MEFVCPYSMSHPERSSSFATRSYEVEGPSRKMHRQLPATKHTVRGKRKGRGPSTPHLFASEEAAST